MAVDPQTRKLARQLAGFDQRLNHLETIPQLAHSSIDDHGLPVYDKDGNLVQRVGKQADGTWGSPPLAGPVPSPPVGVSAVGGAGIVHVRWSGEYAWGAAPLDFDALEVLVDGVLAGAIPDRDGGSVTVQAEQGSRYVSARVRTLVPHHSSTTSPFSVSVHAAAEILFEDMTERADDLADALAAAEAEVVSARERLDTLDETTLPAVRDELEQAAEDAQAEFQELDERLNSFGTDPALDGLRGDLQAARDVADSAASAASAANDAASAASQAALEAAGIAASKGRVIIQDTEPTGDDRQAANIWIKPVEDDPDTEVEERAVTYVYLEASDEWIPTTSDELAQAAQNALDAREAAQQAQQRAETAISNAATAQGAAEAAQRTADEATTDARDAWNEAVAAGEAAGEAYAEAASKLDESEIDAKITTSANGKNSITRSRNEPTSDGVVRGDQWYRVDGHGNAFASWYWGVNGWTPSLIRNEMIDTLDVNKLKVHDSLEVIGDAVIDKLWVDGIAAKSIAASRVVVSSGNIYRDPDLSEPAGWDSSHWSPTGGHGGGGSITIQANSAYSASTYDLSPPISGYERTRVQPGTSYAAEAWVKSSEAATGTQIRLYLRWHSGNTDTGFISLSSLGAGVVPANEWARADFGSAVAPEGATHLSVAAYLEAGTRLVTFSDISIRPMVGAVLIEDGAVKARHVVADEVAAAVGEFVEARMENVVITEGASINSLVAVAIAGATADFQEAFIQNLRSTGATIDEAVIGDLASNIITSGLFRTASEGQRLEIDSNGLVMYGADPDGVEFELVRIGPDGDNLITAGDTTISPSGVQASSADFGALSVDGEDLTEILDALPRGIVGNAYAGSASVWHGDGSEVRRLELDVTLRPGRRYRVTLDHNQVVKRTAGKMGLIRRLKHTHTGGYVPFVYARQTIDVSGPYEETLPPLMGYISTSGYSADVDTTIGFTIQGTAGNDYRIFSDTANSTRLTVEDLGPEQANTGEDFMGEGTSVEGSNTAPPAEPPRQKRYTKTYNSTGYRVYDNNDNATSDPDVVQGLYAGGPTRLLRKGGWLFPSMTGDLAGATIESVKVKVYCNHTYYSAGSTVNLCWWGGVMATNLNVITTINRWKRNTAKWITLPSSYHNGFKSGTIAGIGVKPTSTSSTQYARFANNAIIEITYRK